MSNRAPASAPTGPKTNTAPTVAGGKKAAGSTVAPAAAPASAPTGPKTNTASTVAGGKKAAGSTVAPAAAPAASGTDFATVSNTYLNIWKVTPYTRYVRIMHYVSLLVIVLPRNLGARAEFGLCVLILSAFLELKPR